MERAYRQKRQIRKSQSTAPEDGTLAAALDVFWEEGCAQQKKLTERSNVVLKPHLGGSACECDMTLVNGVMGY